MQAIAKSTYIALTEAGASKDAAVKAAAETGEIYIDIKTIGARQNLMFGIMLAGFTLVLGALVQVLFRLSTMGS